MLCGVSSYLLECSSLVLIGWSLNFKSFTLKKIRVFKAGIIKGCPCGGLTPLNTLAWDNRIGLCFYFVGF